MQRIFVTRTDAIARVCAPIRTTDTHRKQNFVVRFWGPFFGPLFNYTLLVLFQFWARFWFLKWGPKIELDFVLSLAFLCPPW